VHIDKFICREWVRLWADGRASCHYLMSSSNPANGDARRDSRSANVWDWEALEEVLLKISRALLDCVCALLWGDSAVVRCGCKS
jgi:hypothetical protein